MDGDKLELPAIEGGAVSRFLVFGSPLIGQEEIDEVVASMKSGWIGTGPKTAMFEKMVMDYTGVKYAIGLNSCTAGMHLALLAFGIGPGDEVITTPMTFAATANVIEHVGAKPVFADIELPSMNIDPKEIIKKINKKTKAIMPVHYTGRPCNMDKILEIAKKYKLKVIEDAAHAFGASYHGRKIGGISDATIFSFYVTKNITTAEGGILTTNSKEIADFVRINSLHGMSRDAWKRYSDEGFKHYLVEAPGYKYNMIDLHAAIGIHQLARFDSGQKIREDIWKRYNQAFSNLPLFIPPDPEINTVHSKHLYTILVDLDRIQASRDDIQQALHAEGIGVGIHFVALHLHPFYKNKYKYKRGDFVNSEYVSDRTISLPFSAKLTETDVNDVIRAVRKVMLYYTKYAPKPLTTHLPKSV